VAAGSFGGSRDAIVRAEAARNLQTQLGDIQYKGLAAAYEDAQARLAAQRQREFAAGQQFGQLGQTALGGNLQELSALQQAGLTQQSQQQAALDIARQQFEAEKTFPEQTLQQYSSIIRGYAAPIGGSYTSTGTTPAPSYLQQLAGLGSLGTGLYAASKMFKEGGKIGGNGGLASIIVKRKKGGSVVKLQDGGGFGQSVGGWEFDMGQGNQPNVDVTQQRMDEYLNRLKTFSIDDLKEVARVSPEYRNAALAELKSRKPTFDPAIDEAGPTGPVGSATSYDNFKPAATTAQAAASTSTDAKDSDEIDFSDPKSIFKNFFTSSDEYRKAYTESLEKMRESAKTDKELAGLNLIQKSLSAIASSRPGSIGAVIAESSPVVAEATSAALKADKEARAELRAAELGEKKLGYEMEKEMTSTKMALWKALQKTKLTTDEATKIFKAASEATDENTLKALIGALPSKEAQMLAFELYALRTRAAGGDSRSGGLQANIAAGRK